MKPKIDIGFNNGVIVAVTPLDTGVFGFIASAEATEKFELNKAYQVKSLKDVANLGINGSIENYRLFKALSEFFAEAGEGQEAWIFGMDKSTKVSDWFTPVDGVTPAEELLQSAQGKIRGIFTVYDPTNGIVLEAGEAMDPDVQVAAAKAQILFESFTAQHYAPFFTILEGHAYTGEKVDLEDLTEKSWNSVGVLIGDTENRSDNASGEGAAVGVLAGRLAAYSPRVNPGKVRNGALRPTKMFIVDKAVELSDNEAVLDKGYITFTTHAGRSGYYFIDAPLACPVSDDYHYITHRRIINEAFRLTYDALLDFLLDEVPANADGTIQAVYAKTMESAVVRKVSTSMGEDLSADVTDIKDVGVKCYVDPWQNIVSTSRVNVNVSVRPFGYNRWIDVMLGFELEN